jgi:hypothetical protein
METVHCQMAIERLLTYLDQPDFHQTELDAALRHIAACRYCEQRVGYLVRALNTPDEDTLTCEECEELLPEYYQADIEGHAAEARWRPVARHLATCAHCSGAYTVLTDLSTLAFNEQDASLSYPPLDLSFLGQEKKTKLSQPEPLWWLDEWGHLIIQFSAELIRAWQPPTFAAGLKKSETSPSTLGQFSVQTKEDLEVTITAERQRNDPTYCTMTVQVNIPSRRGWPNLADTEVTLKQGEQLSTTHLTNAFGEVIFEGIATADLAKLSFEITPEQHKG